MALVILVGLELDASWIPEIRLPEKFAVRNDLKSTALFCSRVCLESLWHKCFIGTTWPLTNTLNPQQEKMQAESLPLPLLMSYEAIQL